jgi:hypothetical protein
MGDLCLWGLVLISPCSGMCPCGAFDPVCVLPYHHMFHHPNLDFSSARPWPDGEWQNVYFLHSSVCQLFSYYWYLFNWSSR